MPAADPHTLLDASSGGTLLVDERLTIAPCRTGAALKAEDASRVSFMRRITATRLARYGLEVLSDDVVLVVSELLTNALQHSGATCVSVRLAVVQSFVHIVVEDGMPAAGIKRTPVSDQAEAGRGLHLVAALAHERGGAFGFDDEGSTAWCTLSTLPTERP